ncbi:hypothetical protein Ddc_18828 [Ditylenchus destructor]|nr:hypothetical protein Ddc_18828 [Ditylenchus destructor]
MKKGASRSCTARDPVERHLWRQLGGVSGADEVAMVAVVAVGIGRDIGILGSAVGPERQCPRRSATQANPLAGVTAPAGSRSPSSPPGSAES